MYLQYEDPETSEHYGSFEVWYHDARRDEILDDDGNNLPSGWYWWACFPGCLPDGEPSGPFETEAQAIADAQDF